MIEKIGIHSNTCDLRFKLNETFNPRSGTIHKSLKYLTNAVMI